MHNIPKFQLKKTTNPEVIRKLVTTQIYSPHPIPEMMITSDRLYDSMFRMYYFNHHSCLMMFEDNEEEEEEMNHNPHIK